MQPFVGGPLCWLARREYFDGLAFWFFCRVRHFAVFDFASRQLESNFKKQFSTTDRQASLRSAQMALYRRPTWTANQNSTKSFLPSPPLPNHSCFLALGS